VPLLPFPAQPVAQADAPAARRLASTLGVMKTVPSTFRDRFHTHDSIWADCYVGYKIEQHSGHASTKEFAVAWLQEHDVVDVFGVEGAGPERLRIDNRTLREVDETEAIDIAQTMLNQAMIYGSSARLPAAELQQLGQLFLSEFEAPLIFSNLYLSSTSSGPHLGSWNQVVAGYGYSLEAFLCCIDPRHIGFLFSIENE
jgi:hypothetical protein